MDLRQYNPSSALIDELKEKASGYQPFILSDTFRTGAGFRFENYTGTLKKDKNETTEEDWRKFTEAADRQSKMYDDWIAAICDAAGDFNDVTDTASNDGYFLFRFLQKGAARAIGYDILPAAARTHQIINEITGLNTEFILKPYDMLTHEIHGAEKTDIVISSAIMLHLSDPLYYLAFLGSITKKALFLFTAIDESQDFRITYNGKPRTFYPDRPFPICFDSKTSVSFPLIEFGLKDLGFNKIIELPYSTEWTAMNFYKHYKAIIALR